MGEENPFAKLEQKKVYLSGSHELSEQVHFEGIRASAGNLRHLKQSSH